MKVLGTESANRHCQYSFDELDQSLNHIGLAENVKDSVYKILAAILHLCNLEFDDDAKILNDTALYDAAKLLKLDPVELRNVLTYREFKTRAENSSIL